jgi:hypothetical protein
MTSNVVLDEVGWLGAALVVAAYALVSFNRLSASSPRYQALNIVGSLCLIINTAWHAAWPSTAVNIIWAAIALMALTRHSGGTHVSER